jgi:ABC-2 type transport system permease protein
VSGRESVRLVARREIVERIAEKSFVISTLVSLVIVAGIAVLPNALGIGGKDEFTVAVEDRAMQPVADAAVRAADAFDARVELGTDDPDATLAGGGIRAQEKPEDQLVEILQAANGQVRSAAALRDAGLDERQAARALSPPPLRVSTVEPVNEAAEERGGFAFVAVLLLYGQLISMGYFVAMGVVEEKSSRVVELLLSTLRPQHLLAGKILGLGLLGLGQLLLLGVVGLGVAGSSGALDVNGDVLVAAGLALVWFVVGYAFYAAAFACAASLVSRQEDLQTVITPLTIMLMVGFFVSFGVAADPDGTLEGELVHPAGGADDDAAADRAGRGEDGRGDRRPGGDARGDRAARPARRADLQRRGAAHRRDDQAARRVAGRSRVALSRLPADDRPQTRRPCGGDSSPVPATTSSSMCARWPRTRSAISSRIRRAASIPPEADVSCDLIRRTSSIAASARSTSVRRAPPSTPSPSADAMSVRARASE